MVTAENIKVMDNKISAICRIREITVTLLADADTGSVLNIEDIPKECVFYAKHAAGALAYRLEKEGELPEKAAFCWH